MNFSRLGRIFLGICLIGIGILQLNYTDIRPIIFPGEISYNSPWLGYVIGGLAVATGTLICARIRLTSTAIITALIFLLLFAFGHLPAFLSAERAEKLKYWTNLNKTIALSGGFLILASISLDAGNSRSLIVWKKVLAAVGRSFFACMLLLFGIGHFTSTAALSTLVPPFIPFAKFWTFTGGLILVASALTFFANFKTALMGKLLSLTLFVWMLSLHLYYSIRFPRWQEGENFVGLLTCMAFCGTALLIVASARIAPDLTAKNLSRSDEAKNQR